MSTASRGPAAGTPDEVSTDVIRIALVLSLISGCKVEPTTDGTEGIDQGGKGDDGWTRGTQFQASTVLLTPEEPTATLDLELGVTQPVTVRIALLGTRYPNGQEWEEDFLDRDARGLVSGEECIEALHVAGSGLPSTPIEFCLVPIVGLGLADRIARPSTVTANAANGQLSLELFVAPAATRAGHQEIWFFAEATW